MKKVLLLVVCMLVVPSLVLAACPKYQIGYKGNATMCLFGIPAPIVGASVQLSTPENGVVVTKPTDAAGKYVVKYKVNNCVNQFGFYTQAWSVTIDANGLGIPASKTCSASVDFICCCKQCVQSIIKTCKLFYNFC